MNPEMKVFISSGLPLYPSFNEDIVRQVRWGLKDVIEWLGEDVGPKPGEPIHCFYAWGTSLIFVSQEMYDNMNRTWSQTNWPWREDAG